jgi:hypothetical protein
LHVERLVWALVVVAVHEIIELGPLLQEVLRCGLSRFFLQGQVHALVTTILLWMAGLDALDLNAESQPPDGELGRLARLQPQQLVEQPVQRSLWGELAKSFCQIWCTRADQAATLLG